MQQRKTLEGSQFRTMVFSTERSPSPFSFDGERHFPTIEALGTQDNVV